MYPDFVGIGSQRCGSTWLYSQLKLHPDIWLAPIKELHYFDGIQPGVTDRVWPKFFSTRWPAKRYRRLLLSRVKAKLTQPGLEEWLWDWNFFFKPQSHEWYASLFNHGVGKCTGEITPGYTTLSKDSIADIYAHFPDMKILLMLRDPIDRSWSQIHKEFSKHKKGSLEAVSEQEWRDAFNHPRVTQRSNYLVTLGNWCQFYPREQIFIGFFEDIHQRPRELLKDVFQFLNVRSSEEVISPDVTKKVNAGKGAQIPELWERYLANQYIEMIREMNTLFPGQVTQWLRRAEALCE